MAAKLKVQSNVFGLLIGSYTFPGVSEIENMVSTPSNNHIFSLQVSRWFITKKADKEKFEDFMSWPVSGYEGPQGSPIIPNDLQ